MRFFGRCFRWAGVLFVVSLGMACLASAQEAEQTHTRAVPGITVSDAFPMACVSCHVVLPDGRDTRLSTFMRSWTAQVDPALLAIARAAAPAGAIVKGRHPDAGESLADIPAGCLTCHGREAALAPPFARLMHRIHLVGGAENHFMTLFKGECTYCHKLDAETGAWSIPSGPEPGN